jgi:hypothetical protein
MRLLRPHEADTKSSASAVVVMSLVGQQGRSMAVGTRLDDASIPTGGHGWFLDWRLTLQIRALPVRHRLGTAGQEET